MPAESVLSQVQPSEQSEVVGASAESAWFGAGPLPTALYTFQTSTSAWFVPTPSPSKLVPAYDSRRQGLSLLRSRSALARSLDLTRPVRISTLTAPAWRLVERSGTADLRIAGTRAPCQSAGAVRSWHQVPLAVLSEDET